MPEAHSRTNRDTPRLDDAAFAPFEPDGLTVTQRYGDACVVCHRKWPRPRVRVGRLPDGGRVLACAECATVLRVRPRTPCLVPS